MWKNCIQLQIPVFRGLAGPLVGAFNTLKDHFGSDGLGDVLDAKDPVGWEERVQKEHAVAAMVRLVSENPGQVNSTGYKDIWATSAGD